MHGYRFLEGLILTGLIIFSCALLFPDPPQEAIGLPFTTVTENDFNNRDWGVLIPALDGELAQRSIVPVETDPADFITRHRIAFRTNAAWSKGLPVMS